jgi:acylphosphatase
MGEKTIQFHAIVKGVVQGVGFRASTQWAANRFQVTGWVRNLPDGNVEVRAEGDRSSLDQLYEWLQRGPRWARVTAVDIEWIDAPIQSRSFEIRD